MDDFGAVTSKMQSDVLERVKEEFPPERLNPLDSMAVFNWLMHRSILHVVHLRLADIAARLVQSIKLNVDDTARVWLAQ